jgi:hypothetical protein
MRIKTLKEANDLIDKLNKEVEYLTFENKQINGLMDEIEKSEQYKNILMDWMKDAETRLNLAISLLDEKGLDRYSDIVYKLKLIPDLVNDLSELKETIDFNNIQEYMENKYPNLDGRLAEKISELTKIYLEELGETDPAEFEKCKTTGVVPKRIYEINEIIGSIK